MEHGGSGELSAHLDPRIQTIVSKVDTKSLLAVDETDQ